MKRLGLSSPYATVGLYSALFLILMGGLFTERPAQVKTVKRVTSTWTDEIRYVPQIDQMADVPTDPCYTVRIDAALLEHLGDYQSGNLTHPVLEVEALSTDAFKQELARRLGDRTWEDAKACDKGSFILTFAVDADGKLGHEMLAHHIQGLGRSAALATRVLQDLETEGHRWHEGELPEGQVHLPVRYVLN